MNTMCSLNDGVDDEEHIFCSAPFDSQRRILLDGVLSVLRPLGFTNPSNELLTQILLYGCKDLPFVINREISKGTLWYMKEIVDLIEMEY